MDYVIALGLGVVLMPVVRWAGERLGVVDQPDLGASADPRALKIHPRAVSLLGGVGVTVATLAAPAVLGNRPSAWIALAALIALAVGLADDVRPLGPVPRLAGLVLAGTALGEGLIRAGYPAWWMAPAILLALVCTNAVNLLDGQDGLAGGVGLAAALGLAVLVPVLGVRGPTAIGGGTALPLALAGGLMAFLLWNRPPARLFLGNGGAYALGVLLAGPALSLWVTHGWRGVLATGVVLSVLAFELITTVIRRVRTKATVTAGDRRHSYDVVATKTGRTRSTLIFWGAGALAAGLGLLAGAVSLTPAAAVVLGVVVFIAVAGSRLWKGSAE